MQTVETSTAKGPVRGRYDPRFEAVLEAFVANFEAREEVGACVAITLEGKSVVDLWGGRISRDGEEWQADSIGVVHSCTKGASALCAHMAADRGQLDFDAPVTDLWPEFGKAGKENARVAMMLDHSVGVPGIREKLPDGAFYDYEGMVERLAAEAPFWEPGTRNGYHGVTSAWTVGEMVRRSTGKRMGRFLADEVCRPLGVDFHMGLPESEEGRVVRILPAPIDDSARTTRIAIAMGKDPMSPTGRFMLNMAGMNVNKREARAAEIGSATGVTNARGLAGLYAPLANGGALNGMRLVGADTLARMAKVSVATHDDATLRIPTRFSLGFMKSMDNRRLPNAANCSAILSEPAFGHVGAGGSIGFADPGCTMSFGYMMNQMGQGILLNDRGQSLVDAAYRSLGYNSNASGVWIS
jgi:CubicO group peptidase (beta-lactamase class C family)